MSKILKNNTVSAVNISDAGISIAGTAQYTIQIQDYLLFAASSDLITLIGNGTLIMNDGSKDLNISDGVDHLKGIFPTLIGMTGPSGTQIGTVGDRLKVDAIAGSPNSNNSMRYDDMNSSNGGVSRNTSIGDSWTKVYDSTLSTNPGTSGTLTGFLITLEKMNEGQESKRWNIRLVVDSNEIFSSDGISSTDLSSDNVYGFSDDHDERAGSPLGITVKKYTFFWESPQGLPISYSSGIQIYVKKLSQNKKFRAGLVSLTKD